MLICIEVKFIFNSVRLGLSSSTNILQIADVALRVVFLLFLLFLAVISPSSSCSSYTLETSEVSAILVFTMKTTQPHFQVFSVNGALTCRRLHF